MEASKMNSLKSATPSKWKEIAGFIVENETWLGYSQKIATIALDELNSKRGLTKKSLAEKMNVTPQYVSKLLKGQENLTLKTIAELEKALNISLIHIGEFQYEKVDMDNTSTSPWLSDEVEYSSHEMYYTCMSV
ncbi:MAG: helix-turn-helix transcriptional regulator [Bacteroidales bacterium]|nr:helix-turn-helix transcriptional regulator [Bacteroidales bacterium]